MPAVLEATGRSPRTRRPADTTAIDSTPSPPLVDAPEPGEIGRRPEAAALTGGLPGGDPDPGHPAKTALVERISSPSANSPVAVEQIHAGTPYAAKHRAPETR
jgi:hypothetical protein